MSLLVRELGQNVDYQSTYEKMDVFTNERDQNSQDELWLLEHPPIYTLGVRSREEFIPNNGIPIVQSNRGGLVTYHGPGQIVGYVLIDMARIGIGIKDLVLATEDVLLAVLANFHIYAERIVDAPGLYINNSKVAAMGYRVRKGCSYHGFSLNVDMDLTPYENINACGLGLSSTMMTHYQPSLLIEEVKGALIKEWSSWHARFIG